MIKSISIIYAEVNNICFVRDFDWIDSKPIQKTSEISSKVMKMTHNAIGRIPLTACLLVTFVPILSQAHDENVHRELSRSAYLSSDGLFTFLSDNLNPMLAPFDRAPVLTTQPEDEPGSEDRSPMNWLIHGSYMEDMQPPAYPPIPVGKQFLRSSDHFYTVAPQRQPGEVIGLTDSSESYLDPA
jgi:hypothetical protein